MQPTWILLYEGVLRLFSHLCCFLISMQTMQWCHLPRASTVGTRSDKENNQSRQSLWKVPSEHSEPLPCTRRHFWGAAPSLGLSSCCTTSSLRRSKGNSLSSHKLFIYWWVVTGSYTYAAIYTHIQIFNVSCKASHNFDFTSKSAIS